MTRVPEKKKILIVDDAPENIHLLSRSLEGNYDILFATDGEKALEIAVSNECPDLILLDVIMPGMDGYEVCSKLKAHPETRNIPVIFITAMPEVADETKGLELGAIDYISKPFRLPVVRARVAAALRLKEEMDQRLALTRQLQELNRDLENRVSEKVVRFRRLTFSASVNWPTADLKRSAAARHRGRRWRGPWRGVLRYCCGMSRSPASMMKRERTWRRVRLRTSRKRARRLLWFHTAAKTRRPWTREYWY